MNNELDLDDVAAQSSLAKRELNLCPACEKHEDLCQCVTMATSSPNSSETIEENFVF